MPLENYPPMEIPDESRKIPIETQRQALEEYKDLIDKLILKTKEKLGSKWQRWFYIEKLEAYTKALKDAGYTDSERSHRLAYHPLWSGGPTEDFIYEIDFPGELSVRNFCKRLDKELDAM